MSDFELAYRKAEIAKAESMTKKHSHSINFHALRLTNHLLIDLMAEGLSFENASKMI